MLYLNYFTNKINYILFLQIDISHNWASQTLLHDFRVKIFTIQ